MIRSQARDADSAGNAAGAWWCLTLVLGAILYLFRSALFANHTLLFRDVAHFYGPLWEWARSEWGEGRIPLWDPFQNVGEPHLADGSSSVFYPGKLLFLLPGDFQRLFHLFLVAHVGLAALTMFRLVRAWRGSVSGAGLAAISYCLGGCVLFQYCNPPFLIGAAWLPAALASAERMLRERTVQRVVWLAGVLAMMVLGGDAQTVYHVGLMMILLAWMQRHEPQRGFAGALAWITLAAALTFLLAAVQVLPTASRTAASERTTTDQPRSLYELASAVVRDDGRSERLGGSALLGRTQHGTHHERAFQFSVGPWRWLELVWPNIGGRIFPRNARWMSCLPAEGRVWVPTLYMGLLPVLFAICRVVSWRSMPSTQLWMAVATLLSILAGLGIYGGGWLADEVQHAFGRVPSESLSVGWGCGGLYWLMTVLLPYYVYFRYPAKLWTIAACGISLLAAMGWDHELATGAKKLRRALCWLGSLSVVLFVSAVLARTAWLQVMTARAAPHALLGPFDATAAFQDVAGALAHTTILCGICWCSIRWLARRESGAMVAVLLVITTVELIVAQRWLVPSAEVASVSERNVLFGESWDGTPSPAPPRVYRGNPKKWHPAGWASTSSTVRLAEVVSWDRHSLFPQYQHAVRCGLVDSPTTIRSRDWSALADVARQYGPARRDTNRDFAQHVLDVLGIAHRIVPPDSVVSTTLAAARSVNSPTRISHEGRKRIAHRVAGTAQTTSAGGRHVELRRSRAAFPRAWVATQVIRRPPLRTACRERLLDRTREIWFPGGKRRDLRHTVVVETTETLPPTSSTAKEQGHCRLEAFHPQRIVVTASLPQDGLVVLCDAFDSGWRAWARRKGTKQWQSRPVLRTNRILKGVSLASGEYEIVFRYLPIDFLAGLLMSFVSWLVWLGRNM